MQTSGLVLDVYDDVHGDVIRGLFSSYDSVPELLKTAQSLSSADRARLPDDAFALVMVNGEERLRKYACTDAGNTALSVFYFIENKHKLPDDVQKVAASNLLTACGWYDIAVPSVLEKTALGAMNAARLVALGPEMVQGARHSVRDNMAAIHAGESYGGAAGGLNALSKTKLTSFGEDKEAELTGTPTMPHSMAPSSLTSKSTTVIKKTGHLDPVINVTTRERAWVETAKQASRYALPSVQRYPIDSYSQVKQAAQYFEEYSMRLDPSLAQEYAENLVKRASELAIELPASVRHHNDNPELDEKLVFASADEDFVDVDGNQRVTGKELKAFALTGLRQVMTTFGHEVAEEFGEDPVGIYKSMPREQKKMLRRMATDNAPGHELYA